MCLPRKELGLCDGTQGKTQRKEEKKGMMAKKDHNLCGEKIAKTPSTLNRGEGGGEGLRCRNDSLLMYVNNLYEHPHLTWLHQE